MKHSEVQKMEERDSLMPLLKELQVKCVVYSEKPDARIPYDHKVIGIEIIGYHRSEDNMKAYSALDESLNKYEKIINERGERGKQITVFLNGEQVVFYNKTEEPKLFEDIEKSINNIDIYNRYLLYADADPILPPNDMCVVCKGGIGICEYVSIEKLKELINKKDLRLQQYKELPQNRYIDEYWLVIYVNKYEYDYFRGIQMPFLKTDYSRVYLTHSEDGVALIKS